MCSVALHYVLQAARSFCGLIMGMTTCLQAGCFVNVFCTHVAFLKTFRTRINAIWLGLQESWEVNELLRKLATPRTQQLFSNHNNISYYNMIKYPYSYRKEKKIHTLGRRENIVRNLADVFALCFQQQKWSWRCPKNFGGMELCNFFRWNFFQQQCLLQVASFGVVSFFLGLIFSFLDRLSAHIL